MHPNIRNKAHTKIDVSANLIPWVQFESVEVPISQNKANAFYFVCPNVCYLIIGVVFDGFFFV